MRLTDPTVAAELKKNYEALQAVGIEPSMNDLRYVKLSAFEDYMDSMNFASFKELIDHIRSASK